MTEFEKLLCENNIAVERFVKFKISNYADAEDILQDIYVAAYQGFDALKTKQSFKAWILSIARHKCNDYFRQKAKQFEVPIDTLSETELVQSRFGYTHTNITDDVLQTLCDKDKQILYLAYFKDIPQAQIAKMLNIPIGTVKSRLHTAKQNFKTQYPYSTKTLKGESTMKKLPEFLPEYKIEPSNKPPFSVKWEELMGWFLVPKLGEKLSWGIYDIPTRKCSHIYDMKVIGKAKVHGIEGVELTAREAAYSDKNEVINRTFVAQLTDTHCRYLATLRTDGDIRNYITFLDGDEFMLNWGFGENNCGNETHLSPKGDIKRKGNIITAVDKEFLLDIVGRYTVTIGGKSYDTVCVIEGGTYNNGVLIEQYLDKNGRTILDRRFNRDDWAISRYKRKWTEMLPENERLTVNGETYVHWYDCITDYIL